MGKAGRKKKESSTSDMARREKVAQRIKALHAESSETYASLAQKIGVAESTLRNYSTGRSRITKSNAELIANYTNTPALYWTGETDCKSFEQYYAECLALSQIDDVGLKQYSENRAKELYAITSFFSLCGFDYENLEATAEEFTPHSKGPHKIVCRTNPGISAQFFDAELQEVFDRVKSLVELECYKKEKA